MTRKPVVGFEGMYEVSDSGEVYSLPRMRKGKMGAPTLVHGCELKQRLDHSGYPTVCLRNGSSSFNRSVHRLVAEAFVLNPNGYDQINHKDENKENNNALNLEWCTQKYNNSYGTRLEKCSKSRGIPVIGTNGETVLRFDSARHAARELGLDASSITAVCKGRMKTTGGYRWQYERREQ